MTLFLTGQHWKRTGAFTSGEDWLEERVEKRRRNHTFAVRSRNAPSAAWFIDLKRLSARHRNPWGVSRFPVRCFLILLGRGRSLETPKIYQLCVSSYTLK